MRRPTIQTGSFEGPLELLLGLIEKNKLSINEVSLAGIADDYVTEVKSRAAVAPDEIAQFLVVASTLMLIKSRSLLPSMPVSEEEEDAMQHLEDRLVQLRRMRELARHIAERVESGGRMYARTVSPELPALFYPPVQVTKDTLHSSMRALISALPYFTQNVPLREKTLERVVSLEEKIKEMMERVELSLTQSFASLAGSAKEKTDIIVSFLALLELIKQGHIAVVQKGPFGDISVRHS